MSNMKTTITTPIKTLLSFSAVGALALVLAGCGSDADIVSGEPGVDSVRRLSESEYRHSIADIFGEDVQVTGRFEPSVREHGLNAVGASQLTITPSGFEQYYAIAADVTKQAFEDASGKKNLPCTPANGASFEQACAEQVVAQFGRRLFRRNLEPAEIAPYVGIAQQGAEAFNDFSYGVRAALAAMMASPDFLFRIERTEMDPDNKKSLRLDGYSKATRLSHFLWNTTPDEELLAAAESGAIHTEKGLQAQVQRMLQSPKLEDGVRALFGDILHLDKFANVSKDGQLYPKFSQLVLTSAEEETLRTIVDHLLIERGDYRELFTLQETYINRTLAAVYKAPFGFSDEWEKYRFPEQENRSGILSQVGFLTLHSHPGDSSPTLRGVAVNEIFRCEETPDPPANVDFSIIQDVNNPDLNTRRKRLMAHATDPSCSGCHTRVDPLGLPLDAFDALGQIRPYDGDELIDVSLEMFGKHYEGAPGLGDALYNDPQVANCLVNHVYGYSTGRWWKVENQNVVEDMYEVFADNNYELRSLFESIIMHPKFFRPVVPGQDGNSVAGL